MDKIHKSKKKILLIAEMPIYGFLGGSVNQRRLLTGILSFAKVHDSEIMVVSPDTRNVSDEYPVIFRAITKSRKYDYLSRFCLHSNYTYVALKKAKNDIILFKPDIAIIGRSRCSKAAKILKKYCSSCKIVTMMENVEADYAGAKFESSNYFISKLLYKLESYCVLKDEMYLVENSDFLFFLTRRDRERAKNLYNYKCDSEILPICFENACTEKLRVAPFKNLVFTGWLHFAANANAVTWFISNVWDKHYRTRDDIKLVIAGIDPLPEVIKACNSAPNIVLHHGFDNIIDVVYNNSLIIAPLFSGSGMKVKMAQALSLSLPVLGTDEALVGYEAAYEDERNTRCMTRANTVEEFRVAVDNYIAMSDQEFEDIRLHCRELFDSFYSAEVSDGIVSRAINNY